MIALLIVFFLFAYAYVCVCVYVCIFLCLTLFLHTRCALCVISKVAFEFSCEATTSATVPSHFIIVQVQCTCCEMGMLTLLIAMALRTTELHLCRLFWSAVFIFSYV